MKVLLLSDNLKVGGVNSYCLALAENLPGRGLDIAFAALGDCGDDYLTRRTQAAGVPLTVVPFRFSYDTIRRVSTLIETAGATLVHTQGYRSTIVGRLAVRLGHLPAKVITTVHGITANTALRLHAYNALEHWSVPMTDHFIAVSSDTRNRLIRKGYPRDRITVVLNGVDSPVQIASPQSQGPVVGYIGRLSPEKGVRRLPAIFRKIRQQLPGAQLVLVGDGPERAFLEQSFDAEDRCAVSFLGSRDDVHTALRALRAVILPSLTEGLPLIVLEAMAAGLPVVATAVGGVPETIEDSKTGFLVERDNVTGLALHAVRLLQDPSLAQEMGSAARSRYEEKFTVEHMVEGTLRTYYKLSR